MRLTTTLVLCAVLACAAKASVTASGAGIATVTLKKITSQVNDRAGVISIEASEPVAYVAAQPDPREFVIELRDVNATGFADAFTPDPRLAFSAVRVETADADGVAVARVRMTLSQPLRPRVRSSRNIIYVEADRIDRALPPAAGKVAALGPASAILHVNATRRGDATAVTLYASGRLSPSNVQPSKGARPQLLIDLPNATSALPRTTKVGQGIVDSVHVGLDANAPLITRVVMDLERQVPYRVESSLDGTELTVVFDEANSSRTDRAQSSSEPASSGADALGSSGDAVISTPGMVEEVRTTSPPPPALMEAVPAVPVPALQTAVATQQPQIPEVRLAVGASAPPAGPPTARALPMAGPAGQAAQAGPPQAASLQAAPQAAQPQPAAPQTPLPGQRFTGFPISLDFQGADLRAVLRTFAEISGLNIVIDPTIQGTVDVALRDVPWDQALDIILRANRLGYAVDGTVVRIAPLTVLAQEEAERQKLAEAQALAGELQTITRTLSYARAEQVQPLITATMLSQRGSITTDPRTNTLIIRDLAERLTGVASLITTLDRPEPQVEIEARIVQTNRDFARRLGVQWGFTGRATPELGNTLPLAFPNQVQVGGRLGTNQGPDTAGSGVNLAAPNASSAVGLALGAVNGALNLDVALTALEETGQGRLLSTPRVTTQNNIEAQITQGIQIPIQTVANNTVTVTFRDAALSLLVVPQITAANTVIMRITVENASPDFSRQVNGIPPIDTQRALTQVLVNDGETTVIGGIYVSREQTEQDRTPGLYRLPLLGWLFQRNAITDESRELLIFITPRIIRL